MITIVIGKPGTGKSYHCTRYLVQYLSTLARKNEIDRKIFTNLSVNLEAFQRYFDRRHININIADVLIKLDGAELRYDENLLERGEKRLVKRGNKEFLEIDPASKAFFWNRFPDNALIIIDEIQKYLSNIKEVGDSEEQSLVEYFSLHRHKKHDWIFLTQNLMSLSISVRRVSEKVVECLNTKSLTLPFPLSIPLRDVQTLLLGFGIQNQLYRVREGRLDGSFRVEYDGPSEAVVMHEEIFNLYQTHTLLESEAVGVQTDSEVPFDLGKGAWYRAIFWFIKKHWFHLTFKLIIFIILVKLFFGFFNVLKDPNKIASYLTADVAAPVAAGASGVKHNDVDQPVFDDHNEIDIDDSVLIFDENLENVEISEDLEPIAPIIKRVIYPNEIIENGVSMGVGSLSVDGRRIISISPRYGVEYENGEDLYLRNIDELDRLRRWLRFQQSDFARSIENVYDRRLGAERSADTD